MKKLFPSLLLLAIGMCATAKQQTHITHPYVEDPQTISIFIEDVSTQNDTTAIKIHAFSPAGNWIRMSKDTYLETEGKKYTLIGAKGIEPNEKLRMPASGDSIFTMYFQALPASAVTFDLLEGTSNDDFKLKGIHTDRSFDIENDTYDTSLLPTPKFEKGTFTLSGKIHNYDPDRDITTAMVYPRCVLGRSIKEDDTAGKINADGTFSLNIELHQDPQPCFVRLPGFYGLAYFSPGEEASIEIDASQRWHNGHHGETGSVEYNGKYGDINNQLATIYGHDMIWDTFSNNLSRNKNYSDVETLKADVLSYTLHRMEKMKHLPLSDMVKALYKIMLDGEVIRELDHIPFIMRIPDIPATYYSFLKEYGLDNPMMMWYENYDATVSGLNYISAGHNNSASIHITPASHFQRLIDSGTLSDKEMMLAQGLMKYCPENIPDDINKARVNAVVDRITLLADTTHLQENDKQRAIDCANYIKATDEISYVDAFNSLLSWALSLPKPNPVLSGGGLKDVYTDPLYKEEESYLTTNEEPIRAFYTKYSKDLENMTFIDEIDKNVSNFRNLSGIEDKTIEALMANIKYDSYIEQRNTLPDAYIADAKARLPQMIFDHLMAKHAEMELVLNMAKYNVLEADPSDDCGKILADIAVKHKGKVVYIDIWAVWCGPCLHAISEIQPEKKNYSDNVDFVYLADESSPKDAWSEKIKSIEGDHYRLTQTQMQSVMSRFGFNSYPSYIVIGKNGEIAYSGFLHGLEEIKELLDSEISK